MVDINLLPFKHKHLPLLIEMLKKRDFMGINDITTKSLPKCGYIAMLNKEPLAAGFLRKVEGGYAQMDGLTSNPIFGSSLRHQAISLVVDMLIKDAKRMKLKGILAFTADVGVLTRAADLGFHTVDQSVIALRLGV